MYIITRSLGQADYFKVVNLGKATFNNYNISKWRKNVF